MAPKDFLDMADSLAKHAFLLMQALMIATIAVVGWFVASDPTKVAEPLSGARIIVAICYALFGAFITFGYNRFIHRAQLAVSIAHRHSPDHLKGDREVKQLLSPFAPIGATAGLPAIVLVTVCIVLFVRA